MKPAGKENWINQYVINDCLGATAFGQASFLNWFGVRQRFGSYKKDHAAWHLKTGRPSCRITMDTQLMPPGVRVKSGGLT